LRFARDGVLRQEPYCIDLQARDLTIQAR
ncbi:hypothetical protein AWZ03_015453, partial [Drosophila navojoa]